VMAKHNFKASAPLISLSVVSIRMQRTHFGTMITGRLKTNGV
jgi:hypothetical protein